MNKLFFFFCVCFLFGFEKSNAGNLPLYFDFPHDTNTAIATDTVPYVLADAEEEMDEISDSLGFFPANGLYTDWDTTHIHFPKFNVKSLNDSIELTLCDKNSCGYVHPFLGDVTSSFGPRKRRFH